MLFYSKVCPRNGTVGKRENKYCLHSVLIILIQEYIHIARSRDERVYCFFFHDADAVILVIIVSLAKKFMCDFKEKTLI